MTRDSSTLRPRKRPVQARSRATYDRIVETAARVLGEDGLSAMSMNRVATEAHVSPGTLYQYFPNRDALVLEVFDRTFEALGAELATGFQRLLGEPLEVVAQAMVELVLDRVDEQAEVLRAVFVDIPRRESAARISAFMQRISDILRAHVVLHRAELEISDPDVFVWMLTGCAEAIVAQYVINPPPAARDVVARELVMFAATLRRDITRAP